MTLNPQRRNGTYCSRRDLSGCDGRCSNRTVLRLTWAKLGATRALPHKEARFICSHKYLFKIVSILHADLRQNLGERVPRKEVHCAPFDECIHSTGSSGSCGCAVLQVCPPRACLSRHLRSEGRRAGCGAPRCLKVSLLSFFLQRRRRCPSLGLVPSLNLLRSAGRPRPASLPAPTSILGH